MKKSMWLGIGKVTDMEWEDQKVRNSIYSLDPSEIDTNFGQYKARRSYPINWTTLWMFLLGIAIGFDIAMLLVSKYLGI